VQDHPVELAAREPVDVHEHVERVLLEITSHSVR
jgi:hypothetical protein